MSVIFSYGDVSSIAGSVTRTISVATNELTLPSYFTAFQLSLDFDPSVVDIVSWNIAESDPQSIQATNPTTPELASETGSFRVSGVSLTGIAPGTNFLTLTYTQPTGANPGFQFSNVVIDETIALSSPIVTTYTNPNQTLPVTGEPTATVTINSVIDSDSGLYLYGLADGTAAFSNTVASAGDEVTASDFVVLKLSSTNPVDINAVFASGLVSIDMQQVGTNGVVALEFTDGTRSSLSFNTASGLLTDSATIDDSGSTDTGASGSSGAGDSDSSISDQVSDTIPDGINLGTGTIDAEGVEVDAWEIEDYFDAGSDALVIYRQRLDDAVAFEAMAADGTLTGKFVGDGQSRTVATINTGSLDFVVDTPAGVDIEFWGLSGNASTGRASSYLNGLVDTAYGTSPAIADIANSVKTAIAKMTQAHSGENVDLKVIMPTRQINGTDEISISAQGSGNNVAAVALSGVEDLITTSGFESLVAVGPGRLQISGSSPANVFGDGLSQEIIGGNGSDLISGGGGLDSLTGGAGSDTFEVGFSGTTLIGDLAAEDTLKLSLFGVSSLDQLASRIVAVSPGQQGLVVQFDSFALELVGYNDLAQFGSAITFG